ncbi:hypothetical protein PybrP1_005990 [[Pythium] brassicae (nom. inval.)]|nr:hypothetical protein PybrP1_005990 [[Pythium] brassicae (nom. inval.)]
MSAAVAAIDQQQLKNRRFVAKVEPEAAPPALDDAALGGSPQKQITLPQLSLGVTAAVAGAIIGFWVVSFPRCVVMHPEGTCEWLGLSVACLPAVDRDGPWNFYLAHWLLAAVLFAIGVLNALQVDRTRNFVMTASSAGYAIVTALFAVFRAQYGLSKPLLIGAALHNFFEWVFVGSVTHATGVAKKRFVAKAGAWILVVVFVVALVPGIKTATLIEQSVGIMLDFFLVLSFFELAVTGPDAEVRSFYLLPFVATAVHLFLTILPLVFANFAVGSSGYFVVVNELMIYFSPVATHAIFYVWGQAFDARCNAKGDMEQRFMVTGYKFKMATAFAIGFIPLIGIASHAGSCEAPTVLTGTAVARVHPGLGDAFADRVAQFRLVETARKAPGNVDYVLARSVQNPDEFRFIEKWESVEAVTQWMTDGLPVAVFREDPVMRQLLAGGQLEVQGAYVDVPPLEGRPVAHGGLAFSLGSACTKVWGVVGDWHDCSWVIGCTKAHVHNATSRTLHFAAAGGLPARHVDETLLEFVADDMMLRYSFTGYEGTVRFAPNTTSGGCDTSYAFRKDGGATQVDAVYNEFLNHRIPLLQQMFSS